MHGMDNITLSPDTHNIELRQRVRRAGETSAAGQLPALPRRSIAVCFTPVSGIDSRSQALPDRANSDHQHKQKDRLSQRSFRNPIRCFWIRRR
jgi:hypothetical protein